MFDRLHTNLADIQLFAAVALLFTLIKWLITPGKVPYKTVIINVVTGVTVGVLAGGLALEVNIGDFGAITIASVATMLSRELLDFLRDKQALSSLAKRAAENIVDKVTK